MNKYIVLYYAPISAREMVENATPEEMKAGMEPWIAWMARCGDALVDPGAPLGGGMNVTASGSSPSDKKVTGYSILQAENMEAAQACWMDTLTWAGWKVARSRYTKPYRCPGRSEQPRGC